MYAWFSSRFVRLHRHTPSHFQQREVLDPLRALRRVFEGRHLQVAEHDRGCVAHVRLGGRRHNRRSRRPSRVCRCRSRSHACEGAARSTIFASAFQSTQPARAGGAAHRASANYSRSGGRRARRDRGTPAARFAQSSARVPPPPARSGCRSRNSAEEGRQKARRRPDLAGHKRLPPCSVLQRRSRVALTRRVLGAAGRLMQAQRRYAAPAGGAIPRSLDAPAFRGAVGALPLSPAAAASLAASGGSAARAVRTTPRAVYQRWGQCADRASPALPTLARRRP